MLRLIKRLEAARKDKTVGKALEADVVIYATEGLANKLLKLEDELRFVLITSGAKVEVVTEAPEGVIATEIDGLWLTVAPSTGTKCERCWHFTDDVGQNEKYDDLCGRCVTNVEGDGEVRQFA